MSYADAFIEAWPKRMEIKQYKFTQCSATSVLKGVSWKTLFILMFREYGNDSMFQIRLFFT